MEEITNLSDFLTEIADAIREKKESTDLIEAQDFANEIRSLESFNGLQFMVDHSGAEKLFAGYKGDDLGRVVQSIDLSQCVSLYGLFEYCSHVLTLPSLDTDSNLDFVHMFYACSNLTTIDLSYINPGSRQSGEGLLGWCYSLVTLIIRRMPELVPYQIVFGSGGGSGTVATSNGLHHFTGEQHDTYNPEGLQDGYVYVPDDKVEALRAAEGGSTIADRIRGLSELDE